MQQIFLQIVRMSLSAGWLVLAALLLRLVLHKAPKRIVCLLWALVAFRLICPAQIEWRASLTPRPEAVVRAAQALPTAGLSPEDADPAAVSPSGYSAEQTATAPDLTTALSRVWLGGVIAMLLWAAWSDVRLRRRLRASMHRTGNVWLCDEIGSPFVLGLFAPRIYLPSGLDPAQNEYVLAHERAHIARGDHWWKLLGWLLLSVYWFHPLLWLAYALLCRDLELACDERVARGLDRPGLAAYSQALLDCSRVRRRASGVPVSFAEVGVKTRVRAILHYQRPTFLRAVFALVLIAMAGAFFLTEQPVRALQLTEPNVALPEVHMTAQPDAVTPEPEQSAPPVDEAEQEQPAEAPDQAVSGAAQKQTAAVTAQAQTSTGATQASAGTAQVQTSEGTAQAQTSEGTAQAQTSEDAAAHDPQEDVDAYILQMNEQYAQENRAIIEAKRSAQAQQSGNQNTTIGPQSAINVQPGQPTGPVQNAPDPAAMINGDPSVIRVFIP